MKRDEKKDIIKKFAVHAKDTGSAQVQIAILSERINSLTEHLKSHKKDNHSRRGLLMLVGKRRKLLNYLRGHKPDEYQKIMDEMNLKKKKADKEKEKKEKKEKEKARGSKTAQKTTGKKKKTVAKKETGKEKPAKKPAKTKK